MKNTTLKLITLITAFLMLSGIAAAKPDGNTKKSWKKLRKIGMIVNVPFYPAKLNRVKTRTERGFVVEYGPIRAALEKAGIAEPVTIEVRCGHDLLERLGTFTPTVEKKDGNVLVSFDSMPVGRRVFRDLLNVKTRKTDQIQRNDNDKAYLHQFLHLFFKNAKGKTKAKLRVTFLKH